MNRNGRSIVVGDRAQTLAVADPRAGNIGDVNQERLVGFVRRISMDGDINLVRAAPLSNGLGV